jgi:pimeloyl-ACP methyl ester carboxylesterase
MTLPGPVADALAHPIDGTAGWVETNGVRWATLSWGRTADPPLLLVHGVTSNARVWWRVGPALAAAGRYVVAVDMPGHGRTGSWRGRHRFSETAADVVALVRAVHLDRSGLAVVGHSWGAMVTAHLPGAGLRPAVLILLDPPALTVEQLRALTLEATERPYPTVAEAAEVVRATNPTWSEGDVHAKALALTEFDVDAVLAILVQNGEFDAGMAALRSPEAAGIPAWLIRGDWTTGGLIPDSAVPAIEAQLGKDHVITIEGGPHSPQRTHPEATIAAILRAFARSPPPRSG